MNRFDSPPNHEKRPLYEGHPSSGLHIDTAEKKFFCILVTDLPRGHPFGGGDLRHN